MPAAKGTAAVSGQDVFDISSKDFVNKMCNPAQCAHTEQVTTVVAHTDNLSYA